MSAEPANRDEEILQQLQSPAFLIDLRQALLHKDLKLKLL
jgi:hypothetical protein